MQAEAPHVSAGGDIELFEPREAAGVVALEARWQQRAGTTALWRNAGD